MFELLTRSLPRPITRDQQVALVKANDQDAYLGDLCIWRIGPPMEPAQTRQLGPVVHADFQGRCTTLRRALELGRDGGPGTYVCSDETGNELFTFIFDPQESVQ